MFDEALPLSALAPVVSPLLQSRADGRVRHAFFTRHGGVSQGMYAGLNVGLGSHDDRAHVEENRARVARWFGAPTARLATLHQIHSADAVIVDGSYDGTRVEADAIVTATPGLVIGVLSADCGPILFSDGEACVIGAAHAGWKGALTGILESTISAMESLGAKRSRIAACLGPSISRRHYEVGAEFVARFLEQDAENDRFFAPSIRDGHAMFDLPAFTMARLTAAGVAADNLDLCTYAQEDLFFSYRRTTHRKEPDYGRQISAISLERFQNQRNEA